MIKRIFIVFITLAFLLNVAYPLSTKAATRNLQVTGTVEPKTSSFTIDLYTVKPQLDEIYSSEEVTYFIDLESESYSPFPLTVEASWVDGLVEGTVGNYIDVFDYVLGSAGSSISGTSIYIDLINRKLIYNIPDFSRSQGGGHRLSFTLKVKSSFLTNSRILSTVYAKGTYQVAESEQKSYQLYVNPNLTPTPTNTPTSTPTPTPTLSLTPTLTPTSTSTPTPTPTLNITPTPTNTPINTPTNTPTFTPKATITTSETVTILPTNTPTLTIQEALKKEDIVQPLAPIFQKISIESVEKNSAFFTVTVSQDVLLKTLYDVCGKKEFKFSQQSVTQKRYHEVLLENLSPETPYCVEFQAINQITKKTSYSEIFTFETAKEDSSIKLVSSVTNWNGLQLSFTNSESVFIPENKDIVLTAEFTNPNQIEYVEGEFVSRSVLGVSTITKSNVSKVRLIETGIGVYSAEIATPFIPDNYLFSLKIKSKGKTFSKLLLSYDFKISTPLKVVDFNGFPIESSRVDIERFEKSANRFVPFNASFSLAKTASSFFLPYTTQSNGVLDLALPEGKYRATVSAIGYKTTVNEFVLGEFGSHYPEIAIEKDMSIKAVIDYVYSAFMIATLVLLSDIKEYFGSRLLYTIGVGVQLFMIIILVLIFILKIFFIDKIKSKFGVILKDIEKEFISFYLGSWTLLSVITSIFFMIFQSFTVSIPFIVMGFITLIFDVILFVSEEKKKLSINDLKLK